MASPSADQRQQRGCGIKSLAKAARQNPARVFAVLAGIAFVCLLGTFVAQVVLAIVHGVSAVSFLLEAYDVQATSLGVLAFTPQEGAPSANALPSFCGHTDFEMHLASYFA